MRLMATLFLSFFLVSCASSFETFEAARQTCYDQGKKLMYNTATLEPLQCMTDAEFAAFPKTQPTVTQRPSDAETLAAGMILQGFALRPIVPAPLPYNPPPLPAFAPSQLPRSVPPVSCSSTFVGGYAQTDCY